MGFRVSGFGWPLGGGGNGGTSDDGAAGARIHTRIAPRLRVELKGFGVGFRVERVWV